jgi:hypothetical protein
MPLEHKNGRRVVDVGWKMEKCGGMGDFEILR